MIGVKFFNLGNIRQGEIVQKDLTIFCSSDNTGKTYAAYALYCLLDKEFRINASIFKEVVKTIYENGIYEINIEEFAKSHFDSIKKEIENNFSKQLPVFFSASPDDFKDLKVVFSYTIEQSLKELYGRKFHFEFSVGKEKRAAFQAIKEEDGFLTVFTLADDKMPREILEQSFCDAIINMLFGELFKKSFLLPAERTGLNLFYQELNRNRNALINHLQKTKINPIEVLQDLIVSSYPQAIADYIDFLNDLQNLKKLKSDFVQLANDIQKEIVKGRYTIDKANIYFTPYKSSSNPDNYNSKMSLHLTSSTVKTFFSLTFYFEHLANKGDCLIIDEPELNLHPDNQRKIAKILARAVNMGLKVVISTHSDYIVREFNNLIMLNDEFDGKDEILKKYDYEKDDKLDSSAISAYLFKNNSICPMKIEAEGIISDTFDEIINSLNSSSDDIYYAKASANND